MLQRQRLAYGHDLALAPYMLRIATILLLAASSAAADTQAAFHVGVRVVSSATVAAVSAAEPEGIRLEVASHGAQAPLVLVGGAARSVPSSREVNPTASSADEVVVTFLY
jgi:hypothetical protein